MKTSHFKVTKRFRWLSAALLGVMLFYPSSNFVGLTGEHWILGFPFETVAVKYTGLPIAEGSAFQIEIVWIGLVLDLALWIFVITLVGCGFRPKRGRDLKVMKDLGD